MKCVILCGGYATRLHPLTLDSPKHLLPVKGRPILDYIIDKVEKIEEVDDILISTNNKFFKDFENWKDSRKFSKNVKILNDGTISNEDRLGGLGNLWATICGEKIDDNILVVLGDNFFEFDLNKAVDFFKKVNNRVVGLVDVRDLDEAKKFGVIELKDKEVVSIEEKPDNPKSSLISTGIYVFPKSDLKEIEKYMKTDKSKDGPGYLIKYFIESQKVFGLCMEGFWYDIGSMETYKKLNEDF